MYILMLSIHGLIRGHDLELGRDADTGGQTKYVVDLARALGERADVSRVDLVTRRVVDPPSVPTMPKPSNRSTQKRASCGSTPVPRAICPRNSSGTISTASSTT
jgi:sucrose-phosphate synthase